MVQVRTPFSLTVADDSRPSQEGWRTTTELTDHVGVVRGAVSPLDIFCATVKSRPERIQLVEFVMGNANDCAAVRDDLEDDADDISIRVRKAPLVASGL